MTYTKIEQLREFMDISPTEEKRLGKLLEDYPMCVPEYYLNLIDFSDNKDPIGLMSIPTLLETDRDGSFDTSGEQENTIIPGLQHKYKQTALILSTNKCAMYCRHCFRKRLVGLDSNEVAEHLTEIADYIQQHEEISNVLISGGDAFMNSTEMIARYLELLAPIDHLDFIRFGTRTPVVLPSRITKDDDLLNLFSEYAYLKQLVVVTQFNHPRELTDQALEAINALQQTGVVVRNQTVLMKDVNADPKVLGELLRAMTGFGVMPYYVFQCRPVVGVKNRFQMPLREGIKITEEAKALQNGLGKSFRYCLSHVTGKIEILGTYEDDLILRYHEAKNPDNYGKLFSIKINDDDCWIPDDFRPDL